MKTPPPSLPPTYKSAANVLRLYLLAADGGVSAHEAAQHLRVSEKTVERYAAAIEGVTGKSPLTPSEPRETYDWAKYRDQRMPHGIGGADPKQRRSRRCVERLEYTTTTTKVNGESIPCCAACLKRYA